MGQTIRPSESFTLSDIERARDVLDQADLEDPVPTYVSTRQARCIYLVPGSVIRIMRHQAMHWRGDYLRVVD